MMFVDTIFFYDVLLISTRSINKNALNETLKSLVSTNPVYYA